MLRVKRLSPRHTSGWPDSNRRPPRPERGALTKLRYNPMMLRTPGATRTRDTRLRRPLL